MWSKGRKIWKRRKEIGVKKERSEGRGGGRRGSRNRGGDGEIEEEELGKKEGDVDKRRKKWRRKGSGR